MKWWLRERPIKFCPAAVLVGVLGGTVNYFGVPFWIVACFAVTIGGALGYLGRKSAIDG